MKSVFQNGMELKWLGCLCQWWEQDKVEFWDIGRLGEFVGYVCVASAIEVESLYDESARLFPRIVDYSETDSSVSI